MIVMPPVIERAHAADAVDVVGLVTGSGLPPDGLAAHLATTLVARDRGEIVGTTALEMYEDGALLRSVAVAAGRRGGGLGCALVDAAIQFARERGAPALYLLTTTAERFFQKFGFEPIARADAPAGVQTSVEFTSACPATATVMRKRL